MLIVWQNKVDLKDNEKCDMQIEFVEFRLNEFIEGCVGLKYLFIEFLNLVLMLFYFKISQVILYYSDCYYGLG